MSLGDTWNDHYTLDGHISEIYLLSRFGIITIPCSQHKNLSQSDYKYSFGLVARALVHWYS